LKENKPVRPQSAIQDEKIMAKDVSAWRKRLDDLKHKTNKKKEQLNSL
jgi:hypothetical protein